MFWNNSRTFYNYLKWLARVSPSLRNRNRLCQHTATSTHLLTFQKTLHCTRKQCSRLLWNYWRSIMCNFQHKTWSQVQTITHTVLLRKQSPGTSNLQRVELWIHFLQLDDIFEPLVRMNSLYGKRWVKCFLSPHTTSHRKQTAHEYKYSQTRLIWTLRGP